MKHPYEVVAVALADEIDAGRRRVGELLPSLKVLASELDVSVSTAQRATKLLELWGYVQVVAGRGVRVLS